MRPGGRCSSLPTHHPPHPLRRSRARPAAPSETKRDGGTEGSHLDLDLLAFPELTAERRTVVRAVADLAQDPVAAARALKLGPRQAGEVERNRVLESSPTMSAIRRYTGVLYDPIGADSLDAAQLAFAGRHVAVHSALLGPVRATDPIPAYRLSHDSRVPGIRMKAHWVASVRRVLEGIPGLVLDLRSEGYAPSDRVRDMRTPPWCAWSPAARTAPCGRSTTSTRRRRASWCGR
ncbi:hypothetical protein BC477_18925 [Clavibacter michiganensis subsp. michiganensis]|uniref:Peroxide stress protein YaaA n=1 Tax=Clavibacter michiganensis subsp. michiganensis TaxID=33013 RepID=A0A251XG83_CLAMM|nr:hypothetical protein BC477_18925 [Clavibacter michiganensis subsp. michiganensis]OUE01558.1 hypothetical protein CMMCAS07_14710 [Clavibacter michiganensis subsp. michiganensis]